MEGYGARGQEKGKTQETNANINKKYGQCSGNMQGSGEMGKIGKTRHIRLQARDMNWGNRKRTGVKGK